ncbi:FecR family protein [Sphingobacterium tabacisoli]|uniref:FecR family protein n=1 Tax=Sphingobacterium tabacisoli TaxID=2044855 RepID=A0ABW5L0G3_9SPHI|nr:FecR family protein [Sphingobacterium tabacisoli]
MNTTRFKQLLQKRYEENLSVEEQEEFEMLLQLYSRGEVSGLIDETIIVDMQMPFEKERVLGELHAKVEGTVRKKSKVKKWLGYAAAASVIGILFWWRLDVEKEPLGEMQASVYSNDTTQLLLPEDVAMITLEDGRSFVMADTVDEIDNAAVHVQRIARGRYRLDVKTTYKTEKGFHTFSTPKGGSNRVLLSDGTEVHLNSASRLQISSRYGSDNRNVRLEGEAYFDVAKVRPSVFEVKAKNVDVQVLGTKFNIRALPTENVVQTTLEEGKVCMKRGAQELILLPGQRATANNSLEQMTVEPVDMDEVLGWKDGYFVCNDQPLPVLLKELTRWYAIEHIIWKKKTEERLTLSLARSRDLKELLERIESIADVRFEIKGRNLVVQ